MKTYLINVKPQKYRFKVKYITKSVYVVPPLVALFKNISLDASTLFFTFWCTENLINFKTTDLYYNKEFLH